jgi:Na+/proline symporter
MAFWGFLLIYGVVLYAVSPRAVTLRGFFEGADAAGRPVATVPLTLSVFISWIFAKSVTNAANLGAEHGVVGALAYATYWLGIPVAGLVIFGIRRRLQATSMVGFLIHRYGHAAAGAFTLAILIRLYNEIWSNTAVVGGYFGDPGSSGYITAALVFTAITVAYSAKGGLRSSLITDAVQAVLFVFFLVLALLLVLPEYGVSRLAQTGSWQLTGGVDLLLVAGLQLVSYPFHDPVLTDRAFINRERSMLTAFLVAGVLGFIAIALFGLVGVHAQLAGLDGGDNVPAAVGRAMGVATLFFMSVVMMSSAGSTLDSTFSSLSKSLVWDLPHLWHARPMASRRSGIIVMIAFAVLGNLPMLVGTEILKATTLSGTMVMGLAPAFLLYRWSGYAPLSFHLSFWTGLILGIIHTVGLWPDALAIGTGGYADLLGANAWGLALCTGLYALPLLVRGASR